MITGERRRPASVISKGTLGEGREVRDHLLVELVVGDLRSQNAEQHGAHEVVAGADRLGLGVPLGIDPGGAEESLVQDPELPQALPAPVLGQQGEQVVELGREGVAVVVGGEEPGRGALEHIELGDLVDEARDELGRAGPRTDDGDPLAGQVDRFVPGGRVERGAGEVLASRERGERRAVELADGADEGVEGLRRGGGVVARRGDAQVPLPRPVVEAGLGHLGGEADDVAQAELLGHALEVGEQVGLGREPRAPLVGLGEGEAVELVGHVDPAARVHVLQPGAADVGVLLEHGDRNAGLAQTVRRGQTGGAGADDRATETGAAVIVGGADLVDVPGRGPGIAVEGELLEQEALPLLGRVLADEEGEGAAGARRG